MRFLTFVYYILTVVGLWKVYAKCGVEGWWSLIPFFRYIKLGEIAGRREEGTWYAVASLITALLNSASQNGHSGFFLGLLGFAAGVITLIAMIRVYDGMCRRFGRGEGWIFGWILFGGITSIIWGFSDDYQPQY